MFKCLGAFLLCDVVVAIPWIGAMETPLGLEAAYATTPRPTDPPGLNGIPRELVRRYVPPYPPPDSWCGFVGGDPESVLSCGPLYTCKYKGTAVGCCTNDVEFCSNLYTTCAAATDTCNSLCQSDPLIIKCTDSSYPYCGVYSFSGGTKLYNCQSSPLSTQTVEYLQRYYQTATGVTTVDSSTADSSTVDSSTSSGIATKNPLFSLNDPASTDNSDTPTTSFSASRASLGPASTTANASPAQTTAAPGHSGLAAGAIAGIAVGAGVLGIAAAVIVFLCIRRRNRQHTQNPPGPSHHQQPMQQHQQEPPHRPEFHPAQQTGGSPPGSYLNPHSAPNHAYAASHDPSSPTKSHFSQPDYDPHRASTASPPHPNPFSPVPSTANGTSDTGFSRPSPTPTPGLPEDHQYSQPNVPEVPGSGIPQSQHQQAHPNPNSYEMPGGQQQQYNSRQAGPWELSNR